MLIRMFTGVLLVWAAMAFGVDKPLAKVPPGYSNTLFSVNALAPTSEQIKRAMNVYRAVHPHCEVPGCTHAEGPLNWVNVHHVIPQEACKGINPWLAADTNNMVSLCRYQHIALGHCGDGACRLYCPNIRAVLELRIVKENKQ